MPDKTTNIVLALVAVGVVAVAVWYLFIRKVPSGGGGSGGGGGGGGGGAPTTLAIQMTANDPSDPVGRYWDIFDASPGTYLGAGAFSAGTPLASEVHISGDTMTTQVVTASKTIYIVITQSGGSGFGSYAGNVTVNGKVYSFTGADAQTPVKIALS